jgi:hypothetical protein
MLGLDGSTKTIHCRTPELHHSMLWMRPREVPPGSVDKISSTLHRYLSSCEQNSMIDEQHQLTLPYIPFTRARRARNAPELHCCGGSSGWCIRSAAWNASEPHCSGGRNAGAFDQPRVMQHGFVAPVQASDRADQVQRPMI